MGLAQRRSARYKTGVGRSARWKRPLPTSLRCGESRHVPGSERFVMIGPVRGGLPTLITKHLRMTDRKRLLSGRLLYVLCESFVISARNVSVAAFPSSPGAKDESGTGMRPGTW